MIEHYYFLDNIQHILVHHDTTKLSATNSLTLLEIPRDSLDIGHNSLGVGSTEPCSFIVNDVLLVC